MKPANPRGAFGLKGAVTKTLLLALFVVAAFVLARSLLSGNKAEARRLVEQGALLVDVRTPEEFARGHLPNAVNLPVDQLPARYRELGPPEKPLVLYCRSGARSGRALRFLKDKGYTTVVNLGPMSAW